MPPHRVRPTRILTAAGMTIAIGSLATWAADPAWAQAAGLDVWNVGRLEDQLRQCRSEAADLELRHAVLDHQIEVTRLLIRDAAAGRVPLAAAAAAVLRTNEDRPGYLVNIQWFFRGPTPEAKVAHHILHRIEMDRDLPRGEKFAALDRLRAEYAAAYGVPAPPGEGPTAR